MGKPVDSQMSAVWLQPPFGRSRAQTRHKSDQQLLTAGYTASKVATLTAGYLQLLLFIDSGLENIDLEASHSFRQEGHGCLFSLRPSGNYYGLFKVNVKYSQIILLQ